MKTKVNQNGKSTIIETSKPIEAKEILSTTTNDKGHEVANFSLSEILAQKLAQRAQTIEVLEQSKATKQKAQSKAIKYFGLNKFDSVYYFILNSGLRGVTLDDLLQVAHPIEEGKFWFNYNTINMDMNAQTLVQRIELNFTNPKLLNTTYNGLTKQNPLLLESIKEGMTIDEVQEIANQYNNNLNTIKSIEEQSDKNILPIYFEVNFEESKVRLDKNGKGQKNNRIKLFDVACFKPLHDYLIKQGLNIPLQVSEADFIA
jgi:hypothetical protein